RVAEQGLAVHAVGCRDRNVVAAAIDTVAGQHADGATVAVDVQAPDHALPHGPVLELALEAHVALIRFQILAGDEHAVEVSRAHATARRRWHKERRPRDRRHADRRTGPARIARRGEELSHVGQARNGKIAGNILARARRLAATGLAVTAGARLE